MIKKLIPVSSPLITSNDAKNVYKVVKSGWVSSSGKEIVEFEKKLAKFVNRKFACAVSSGTAALEIAVKSLDLKKCIFFVIYLRSGPWLVISNITNSAHETILDIQDF